MPSSPTSQEHTVLRCAQDYYVRSATHADTFLAPRRPALSRRYATPSPPVVAFDSRTEALVWMDQEYSTLLSVISSPDSHPEVTAQLADALWGYAQLRQLPQDELCRAHTHGLEAARTLDDLELLARLLTSSAMTARHATPVRALAWLDEAHDLYCQQEDAAAAARTLYYRGHVLRVLEHDDDAGLTWMRALVDLFQARDTHTGALAHTALARLANSQRRHLDAAMHAATAQEVLQLESDEPDAVDVEVARIELGRAEGALGHDQRACVLLEDAATRLESVGAAGSAARALMQAGELHERGARRTQAAASYFQAQALASQGAADLLGSLQRRIQTLEIM